LFGGYLPHLLTGISFATQDIGIAERAAAHYAKGDLRAAISELRRATKVHPRQAFFRFMLGNALYRSGKVREAVAEYEMSLQLEANFEARMSAGFAYYELGDAVAAASQFFQAMQADLESPFARAGLAVALYETGDESNARLQYAQAVRLDARYGEPDLLAIDIRWKSKSRKVLERLKELSQGEE
jgi:Flp pilus assembly protein TadD